MINVVACLPNERFIIQYISQSVSLEEPFKRANDFNFITSNYIISDIYFDFCLIQDDLPVISSALIIWAVVSNLIVCVEIPLVNWNVTAWLVLMERLLCIWKIYIITKIYGGFIVGKRANKVLILSDWNTYCFFCLRQVSSRWRHAHCNILLFLYTCVRHRKPNLKDLSISNLTFEVTQHIRILQFHFYCDLVWSGVSFTWLSIDPVQHLQLPVVHQRALIDLVLNNGVEIFISCYSCHTGNCDCWAHCCETIETLHIDF